MSTERRMGIELRQAVIRKACSSRDRAILQWARWRFRKPPHWCRRIAFSEQEVWEPVIREGFSHWPVEMVFTRFADQDLDDFDLVVPLNVDDALWLAEHGDFNARSPIPVPSPDVVRLCDDKKAFCDRLAGAGFARHVASHQGLSYPYLLKKRMDHSSLNTHIVRDASDEDRLRALFDNDGYFVERLIPGKREYATHINFTAGQVVSEITVEYGYATEQSIKFKDQSLYRRYIRCPDLPLLADMLRALNYEGLCCFNYKVLNGAIVVFELNPRFGGSLCKVFFAFVGAIREPRWRPLAG